MKIKTATTRNFFRTKGWGITVPDRRSSVPVLSRRYLQDSKGEFTVAKDQYVRLNTGWFSDRSACYLAAGRPVITQETGFTRLFGACAGAECGARGLFAFRTLDEIAGGVRAINAYYAAHSRAAFEIAAEHFEATKVVASILDRARLGSARAELPE